MLDFNSILDKLKAIIVVNDLCRATLSNPINKSEGEKISLSRILLKDKEYFQLAFYINNKVTHENIPADSELIIDKLIFFMEENFKQCEIISNKNITVLMNKKRQFSIVSVKDNQNVDKYKNIKQHNNQKNYIIKEGNFVPWMYSLNMMTKDGIILSHMQKKFRQINKFLEMVDDIDKYIPENAVIVDMGCGKSYLSFAMYYYFNYIKNKKVSIRGYDLKKDVVKYCNKLAKEFNFDGLNFYAEDIANINPEDEKINMIITLHACDTATDYALYHAVRWGCDVIMSVPCCQHELFPKIQNDILAPMLNYGILKERFSALYTDAVRAETLELCGYKTNVMEFIDMEHTPKNIMIRAVKKKEQNKNIKRFNDYKNMIDSFNVEPTIFRLLKDYF